MANLKNKNQWWGYDHVNGKFIVKRFFSREDLAEAKASEFVAWVYGPVYAENREEAIKLLLRKD